MATNRKPTRKQREVPQKREHFNIKKISPMTDAQENMIDAYEKGWNVVGIGSAGTGKTYIALWLALNDIVNLRKSKIVIVRSTVPSRQQGFLKGSIEEKEQIYSLPYIDIVNELCDCGTAYETLTKKERIKFMSSSYVRGTSIHDSVLIIDEIQNFTQQELYSVLTRVGENTTVITIGDTRQNDLASQREISGFEWFMNVCHQMDDEFDITEFTSKDIVRSEFVKKLIMANER